MCVIVVAALCPLLFSVFCFSTRPPARHPEAARPPTDLKIKIARPGSASSGEREVTATAMAAPTRGDGGA